MTSEMCKADFRQPACCRYGSYEICNDPYLSANRLSLIDRGFVFALAHVRGGGEMGRNWYEDGKYLHKKNTFTDFVACAEYLVQEKWTSPAHLCIEVSQSSSLQALASDILLTALLFHVVSLAWTAASAGARICSACASQHRCVCKPALSQGSKHGSGRLQGQLVQA